MAAILPEVVGALLSGVFSATVVSAVFGYMLRRRAARIEAVIKEEFDQRITTFKSSREWKEQSVSELLGPIYMQLDRSNRALKHYKGNNYYLEEKVMANANLCIRDLLISRPHLIPPDLLEEATLLIEHYDRWLEEFDRVRGGSEPDLNKPFVFVGAQGFPFPKNAEESFKKAYLGIWGDLYGPASAGLKATQSSSRSATEIAIKSEAQHFNTAVKK